MNIRKCKQCGKMVDFDEPWCDHETMEESAWLNIPRNAVVAAVFDIVMNDAVAQAAKELGTQAGKYLSEKLAKDLE